LVKDKISKICKVEVWMEWFKNSTKLWG
jgi:hypothetical protein